MEADRAATPKASRDWGTIPYLFETHARKILECADYVHRWVCSHDDKAERTNCNDLVTALLGPLTGRKNAIELRRLLPALIAAMGRRVAEPILGREVVSFYLHSQIE